MTTRVRVGSRFRGVLGDSNVLWRVTGLQGRFADCVVESEPQEIDGRLWNSDYAGTKRAFYVTDVARAIGAGRLAAEALEAHEQFYRGLRPGQTVHYDNGAGAFVRCSVEEVATADGRKEHRLVPVALVGDWGPDGTACQGHYGKKIAEREPFRPNFTTLYESPAYAARNRASPAGFPALKLDATTL